MIEILKAGNGQIVQADGDAKDIWIKLTNPSDEELNKIHNEYQVDMDFLKAALDQEEVSRLEVEEDEILVLVNASNEVETELDATSYITVPVGIIVRENLIITVTLKELEVLERMKNFKYSNASVNKKTKFVFQIIYNITSEYLSSLRKIARTTDEIEKNLYDESKNEYLLQLLTLEKNLVYFLTALKSNEQVLNRVLRFKALPFYEEDEDLFEDVIIELKQAQEMATITSQVIRSIRDAFASIISNNLNDVMKILASFTIILTVPTMIYSFFGMNTYLGGNTNDPLTTIVILVASIVIALVLFKIMRDKNML